MIMKMSALCALNAIAHAEANLNLDEELTSLWEIPNRNPDDFADISAVIDDLTESANAAGAAAQEGSRNPTYSQFDG